VRASLGCLEDRVKENCAVCSAEVIAPRLEQFGVGGHESATVHVVCPKEKLHIAKLVRNQQWKALNATGLPGPR
jgi:hypothetical protein